MGGEVIPYWQWDSRSDEYPNNEFAFRRIRPKIKIALDNGFSARVYFELKSGSAVLKDAYLNWEMSRALEVGIGRKCKPFGLEEAIGFWDIPGVVYTEFRELFDDAEHGNRDIGMWLAGKLFQEPYQLEYDVGLYNGHGGLEPRTSEKQFASRIVYSPLQCLNALFSYSTGLDTLGLEWRSAWGVGAIFERGPVDIKGEFASGTDIFTGNDIEGYEASVAYNIWELTPYFQYDFIETDECDSSYSEKRSSIGLMFEAADDVRIKFQGTYINLDDFPEKTSHGEITLQTHARF